jgi:NAD(P)-dependent dehydrogenase (short-subunit alcohol dehydrogenase family)
MKKLEGRNVVVTGAGSGIGRAIALKLAEHGANIAIVYGHNDDSAQTTADMVGRWRRVHCLVNNAGIFREGSVLELSEDDWDDVISVDLKGPFVCTQAVARHMVEVGQGGKIINIGSVDGRGVAAGISCYASAKGGLIQLTRASALELAPHGINVNLVSPGPIATGLALPEEGSPEHEDYLRRIRQEVPLGRMGEAEEVANLVLFLASDESNYITGTEIVIDGGLLLHPYTV